MKKLISMLVSLAVISTMAVSLSANGIYICSEEFDGSRFEGYTLIEEGDLFYSSDPGKIKYLKFYEDGGFEVICANYEPDVILLRLGKQIKRDELNELIKSVNEKFELRVASEIDDKVAFCNIFSKNEQGEYDKISVADIKALYEKLKNYSIDLSFTNSFYYYEDWYFEYMTGYYLNFDSGKEEILRNYIEENNLDVEIVEKWRGNTACELEVVPNKELIPIEHYELAKKIANDTGITPIGLSPTSFGDASATTIEVTDYTNGDANEDGYLTLADSVAILQSIGNPDRYGLSAQGEFNADVDGNAGITGADALVIQQMELGIL